MDDINKKILVELQKNSRITNTELAELINLSPSACYQRVKYLEDNKFIIRYVMVPNLDKTCTNIKLYMSITMKEHKYEQQSKFEAYFTALPEVVDCMNVAGDCDYIALVVCASIEHYNDFHDHLIKQEFGIKTINTSIVKKVPKWFGGYPMLHLPWKDQK